MNDCFKSKSLVEIFEILIDKDIMNYVVLQPTIYTSQNNRHTFQFSVECLQKFCWHIIVNWLPLLSLERMYWSEDEDLQITNVRQEIAALLSKRIGTLMTIHSCIHKIIQSIIHLKLLLCLRNSTKNIHNLEYFAMSCVLKSRWCATTADIIQNNP